MRDITRYIVPTADAHNSEYVQTSTKGANIFLVWVVQGLLLSQCQMQGCGQMGYFLQANEELGDGGSL